MLKNHHLTRSIVCVIRSVDRGGGLNCPHPLVFCDKKNWISS